MSKRLEEYQKPRRYGADKIRLDLKEQEEYTRNKLGRY